MPIAYPPSAAKPMQHCERSPICKKLKRSKYLPIMGAHFGSPNRLGFFLNARLSLESGELSLWIDQSFSGDDDVVAWIQFLKSIDTVFFLKVQKSTQITFELWQNCPASRM
ncbi:MAG: hypothetical protein R3C56_39110 [Pirellulaceae bacterium]